MTRAAGLLGLALLVACERRPPGGPATTALAAEARCVGPRGAPGERRLSVRVGDLARTVRAYAGRGYAPSRAAPLVLNFHGYTSTADEQAGLSGMDALADQRGLIVAYPEGVGRSWNTFNCCGTAAETRVDDVAFARRAVEALSAEYCVDPRRIYATGMSNGGSLAHRLGCELGGTIAAIAPVAGVPGGGPCAPGRPVPVLHFHGTDDAVEPYGGSASPPSVSAPSALREWAARDGCARGPEEFFQRGDSRCVRWTHCRDGAEVALCTVTGGGHTWPGGYPVPALGRTSTDLQATAMMLDFFARHPLR